MLKDLIDLVNIARFKGKIENEMDKLAEAQANGTEYEVEPIKAKRQEWQVQDTPEAHASLTKLNSAMLIAMNSTANPRNLNLGDFQVAKIVASDDATMIYLKRNGKEAMFSPFKLGDISKHLELVAEIMKEFKD